MSNGAGRGIAAAVCMLARPAIVCFGQRRSGRCKGLRGIDRRIEDRDLEFGDGTVFRCALGEEGILFKFLLDEGGEFEMRELQQLDGLL